MDNWPPGSIKNYAEAVALYEQGVRFIYIANKDYGKFRKRALVKFRGKVWAVIPQYAETFDGLHHIGAVPDSWYVRYYVAFHNFWDAYRYLRRHGHPAYLQSDR